MNRDRRKRLRSIIEEAGKLAEALRELQQAEEDARDNMPEALQGTDRYEEMDTNAGIIDEAADEIENAVERLEEIV